MIANLPTDRVRNDALWAFLETPYLALWVTNPHVRRGCDTLSRFRELDVVPRSVACQTYTSNIFLIVSDKNIHNDLLLALCG